MELDLQLTLPTAVQPSPRVLEVAGMFGLGVDEQRDLCIVPPLRLTLLPGQLLFLTGASGGGKSSLLRLIAQAAQAHRVRVLRFDDLPPLPDRPLVDCFEEPLDATLRLLSLAGLSDAFVLLRRPSELSDGQRYRLRLAQVMALAQREEDEVLVLADEFGATLDRLTAMIVARNLRKWMDRAPASHRVCFVAATTHDDLLEALHPDTLIEKHPGGGIEIVQRPDPRPVA